MTNRGTKGAFTVGKLTAAGGVTASSLIVGNTVTGTNGVSAGTLGFTTSSVSLRMVRVPFSAATTGVYDTGFDFPAGSVVLDIWLDLPAAEATASTKTMSVGLLASETGGATAGFLSGVSTASALTVAGSMVAGARTYGTLLQEGTAASILWKKNALITTAVSLTTLMASAHTELTTGDVVALYLAVG